jgi:hypothetical protein
MSSVGVDARFRKCSALVTRSVRRALFLELDRVPSGYVLPEEWAAAEPYLGHPVQIGPVLQYKAMAAC